jgi:hypothetical protein
MNVPVCKRFEQRYSDVYAKTDLRKNPQRTAKLFPLTAAAKVETDIPPRLYRFIKNRDLSKPILQSAF